MIEEEVTDSYSDSSVEIQAQQCTEDKTSSLQHNTEHQNRAKDTLG